MHWSADFVKKKEIEGQKEEASVGVKVNVLPILKKQHLLSKSYLLPKLINLLETAAQLLARLQMMILSHGRID